MKILTDLLENNAKLYPKHVSLVELNPSSDDFKNLEWKEYSLVETGHSVHYRKELTWEGFNNLSNYFMAYLNELKIKKGDKVAILLMNSIDWLPIYFGILKLGAIAVPLNFRYTEDEIDYCLNLSDAKVLVYGPEFKERVSKVKHNLKKIKHYIYVGEDIPKNCHSFEREINNVAAKKLNVKKPTISVNDNAAIYFSSGTTGMPKAILHSHKALFFAAVVEQKHHLQNKNDIFILIPPLYHTGAKMHWMGSLFSASKAVILKGTDPSWILETCSNEKATILWLLVPWAIDILDLIKKNKSILKKYDLSNLRLMHIGAQPVPKPLIKEWLKIFPNQKYDTNYGLTESIGPGCVHLGMDNIDKVGAIGKAGYGWEVKIVDENNNPVKRGEVGELLVKGDGVMKEYYKNKKATSETLLKNNFLKTGDIVKEDKDGFIYIVDRKKDIIICGGENIYPVQIEDFLHKSSIVKDVCVIGIPDNRLGEIPVLIVELSKNMDKKIAKEKINTILEKLPRYKRPRKIYFNAVLRNATGKIDKVTLRKKFS